MSQATASPTRIEKSTMALGGLFLVVGLALAGLGITTPNSDPSALPHAYMFGWVFWACLTFGCFGLTLLHHCARGSWGFPVVRIFEAGGGPVNLAVFGLLLAPVALMWKQVFYPWANPAMVAEHKVLQHRVAWNNLWEGRLVLFFAVFVVLAILNQNWLRQEEKTGDPAWWKKRQFFGGIFLVVFVFCINFLWTDVLMGQYTYWYSTIYGVWLLVGGCLAAFAFVAVVIGTQKYKWPYSDVVEPWLLKDIGNWLLTFTMLWAYFSLSQYLIYWSGNLEEYTKFFIDRAKDYGWWMHGVLLIGTNFFLPFLCLLAPRTKKVPAMLAGLGVYILFARFFDIWFVVTPTWKQTWGINFLDIGMVLAFGGLWFLLFGWQIKRSPLITYRDPKPLEATDHV